MNIVGNVAEKNGGGVYLDGTKGGSGSSSSVSVSGTGFSVSGNSALAGDGGGLYAEADDVHLEFSGYRYDPVVISRFVDNQASGDGGGLRVVGNETAVVSSSDTEFLDNAARGKNGASGNGGGVAVTGGEALFNAGSQLLEDGDDYRPTVGGNTAANDGGGVYMDVDGAATIDLSNITVVGNLAQNNGGGSFIRGSEGSFEAHGDRDPANSNVLLSWIAGNEAKEGSGGAAYIGGGVESVMLSTQMVYLNEAALDGGAIYVDSPHSGSTIVPTNVFVDDSTVGSNKAGGSGGAFYLADGDSADPDDYGHTFEARHSQITDNVALGGNGGAVYLGAHADLLALEGDPSDEQLTIANNSAAMNGGAVYAAEGLRDAWINGAEMDSNKAALDGGALYFAGMADESDLAGGEGLIEVANSSFNGNAAGVNGGAIWLPYEHLSRLTVDDASSPDETSFSNNTASRETESHLLKSDEDVAMHGEKVFTHSFSVNPYAGSGTGGESAVPFSYAYNNYDVSYRDVYVVTYDGNGATSGKVPVDRTSYAPGDAAPVLGQGTLVRDGYAFGGWALSPDSEEPVGATVPIVDADVTLYAIWQADGAGPEDPADPADPTDPEDPAGPKDPANPGADGPKGGVKARGLATTGDPVSFAAALGALALAAAAAGLLTRRRMRGN